jgi:tetratricopeptide (TPR) repeat protein
MARKLANQDNAGFPFDTFALVRCIELAPDFVKGYSRKGTLQYFMKEYDKAVATYEAGLKHDPDNAELKEGMMRCLEAIDRIAHGEHCCCPAAAAGAAGAITSCFICPNLTCLIAPCVVFLQATACLVGVGCRIFALQHAFASCMVLCQWQKVQAQ